MYFKMAFNNVKRSFKDYTIYFLTITFAVCIFYSFNSINNQTVVGQMNESQRQYVEIMNKLISILSIGVSVILGSLIIYATNFLIKRRKKEFGIYMILGMKKRSMSIILFLETLYIGIISLGVGLILGLILFNSVYIGIVFLLASAAVLALQQLSSCNESIERYRALRKIGATKKMINKSILYQVGVFFIFPLVLAIVHSFVGIKVVNNYLIILGSSNKMSSILVTALILIIVYGGYLYGTYISYKNVINNEFD